MLSSVLVATFLVAVSLALTAQHYRVQRRLDPETLDIRQFDFLRRQCRRRLQTSVMIGLVGIAVLVGYWITSPWVAVIYWACVVWVVLWIGLLAMADLVSTRVYFARLCQEQLDEQAGLRAELTRLQGLRGNGESNKEEGLR